GHPGRCPARPALAGVRLAPRLGRVLPAGHRFVRRSHPGTAPGPGGQAGEAQCICSQPSEARMKISGPPRYRPVALYAGLYDFRSDGDDSAGGDLELYRFRHDLRAYVTGTPRVPKRCVELTKVVRYEKNTLVVFPHSPDAVHG